MPTVSSGQDALDQLAQRLASAFAQAEQQLMRTLALQVRAGLEASPENVARSIRLDQLHREAQEVSRALQRMVPAEIERILQIAQERGASAALSEVARVTGSPDLSVPQRLEGVDPVARAELRGTEFTVHLEPGSIRGALSSSPAAAALASHLTSGVLNASRRILRWPDDVYQQAVARSATDLLLGMATQRTAQARAWQDLVSQGVTGFRDSANRNWNLASYVETATRTAVRRAWDDQHLETYRKTGVDLVTIIVGSGACKACADVAGKIWRIDSGPTGEVKMQSALTNRQITVDIEGTLDDAISHGWRHPNCRCRPVAYRPGLPLASDVTTYDPKAEADRAKLRDLERRVRAEKTKLAGALTPEQAAVARARVRGLQAEIRAHVARTGLMRQSDREQVNLGRG